LTLAIVGENAGQALVLDLVTESVRPQEMPHDQAGFVALSPEGERLATSGWHSDQVKIWNGRNGKLLNVLKTGLIARVYFTPDSRELIVARDREFTFHDLKTMEVRRRLPREIGLYPGHVAFTANDGLMALEMAPGIIHLLAVQSGRLVAKLEDPNGDVSTWLGFTPDGTQLIVAARYAGAIHRWDLRAIRERLKNMNLDWDWPEFPAAAASRTPQKGHGPVRIQVINSRPATAVLSAAPEASHTNP
jgi:WD40 repeat protein